MFAGVVVLCTVIVIMSMLYLHLKDCPSTEQVAYLGEAHLVEVSKGIRCVCCRTLSMARFASRAELETFLGRLDPDYSQLDAN